MSREAQIVRRISATLREIAWWWGEAVKDGDDIKALVYKAEYRGAQRVALQVERLWEGETFPRYVESLAANMGIVGRALQGQNKEGRP